MDETKNQPSISIGYLEFFLRMQFNDLNNDFKLSSNEDDFVSYGNDNIDWERVNSSSIGSSLEDTYKSKEPDRDTLKTCYISEENQFQYSLDKEFYQQRNSNGITDEKPRQITISEKIVKTLLTILPPSLGGNTLHISSLIDNSDDSDSFLVEIDKDDLNHYREKKTMDFNLLMGNMVNICVELNENNDYPSTKIENNDYQHILSYLIDLYVHVVSNSNWIIIPHERIFRIDNDWLLLFPPKCTNSYDCLYHSDYYFLSNDNNNSYPLEKRELSKILSGMVYIVILHYFKKFNHQLSIIDDGFNYEELKEKREKLVDDFSFTEYIIKKHKEYIHKHVFDCIKLSFIDYSCLRDLFSSKQTDDKLITRNLYIINEIFFQIHSSQD